MAVQTNSRIFLLRQAYAVKLTVSDGKGGISSDTKTIVVSDPPAPGASVMVKAQVSDVNGAVAGVKLEDVGGTGSSVTALDGTASISLTTGIPHTVKLSKTGYADQFQPVKLALGSTEGFFKAGMIARETAQNLDSSAGGNLAGKEGSSLKLPSNALVDSSGNPVTGTVQISQTPVDISGKMISTFPGQFAGIKPDGSSGGIASYGTTEFALSKNGQRLQLAPGKTATIEIPVYALKNLDGTDVKAGDKSALWSLDEKTGIWVQEGMGEIVVSSASPTGLTLRAVVGHFSWWNNDYFLQDPYQPMPKCYRLGPLFETIPMPCSIGPKQPGEFQFQAAANTETRAVPAGFNKPPNYNIKADIPITGGVKLPVPAGVDFVLHGCSNNGLYCGDLTVHGASGVSEDVNLELKPVSSGGTCASPTTITPPIDADYSLTSNAQASCFALAALAGQVVRLNVKQALSSSLTGSVEMLDSNGQSINTSDFGSVAGKLEIVIPISGTYQIKVSAKTNTPGGFHLAVNVITPEPIALDTTLTAELATQGAVKYYSFNATLGVKLSIIAQPVTGALQGNVTLLGSSLAAQSFSNTPNPFNLEVSAMGAYTFKVTRTNNNGGTAQSFSVRLQNAIPITLGTPLNGSIPNPRDVRVYAFHADAGALVNAAIKIPVALALADGTIPNIRFSGQDNTFIGAINANSLRNTVQSGPIRILEAGTFFITVFTPLNSITPNYTLGVVTIAPPTPITINTPITTTSSLLGNVGAIKFYSVNLNALDEIKLVLESLDTLHVNLIVFGTETGTEFFLNPPATPSISLFSTGKVATPVFVAPTTGTYTIGISAAISGESEGTGILTANAIGNYSWTLLKPNATPINSDTLTTGAISTPFGFNRYSLTVSSTAYYGLTNTVTGVGATVAQQLRDASKNIVQTGYGIAKLNPGTYTLEMNSQNDKPSSYNLNLTTIEVPMAISSGGSANGTIDQPGERDFYAFSGIAGTPITINVTQSGAMIGEMFIYTRYPNLEFYQGTFVTAKDIGSSLTFIPSVTGDFLLEINGQNPNTSAFTTGSYSLSLNWTQATLRRGEVVKNHCKPRLCTTMLAHDFYATPSKFCS